MWKVRFRGSDRRQPLYRLMFWRIHLRSSKNPTSWNHTRWYSIGAVVDFKLQYERAIAGGVTDGTRSLPSGISLCESSHSAISQETPVATGGDRTGAAGESESCPQRQPPLPLPIHPRFPPAFSVALLQPPRYVASPPAFALPSLSRFKGCLHWRTSILSWTNCPTLIGSHVGS